MKRITTMLVCLTAFLAAAPTAPAAIKITTIYFNSPGTDTRSNASLNAEWIRVKNTGTSAKVLTGWTIRDVARHVYRFGTMTIGAGKTVTLHTGHGTNSASHRYWNSGNYIWNNDGDTAFLKNASGALISRCSYGGSGSSVSC